MICMCTIHTTTDITIIINTILIICVC